MLSSFKTHSPLWKNLSIYPQGSPLKGWNLMFMFSISAIQLPIQYLYLFVYHANCEVLGPLWLGASVLAKVLMCNEGVCRFHIGFTWDRKRVKLHSLSYLVQCRGPYILGRYRYSDEIHSKSPRKAYEHSRERSNLEPGYVIWVNTGPGPTWHIVPHCFHTPRSLFAQLRS